MKKFVTAWLGISLLLFAVCFGSAQSSNDTTQLDLIIRSGAIIDGSGALAQQNDLGILAGMIKAIGDLKKYRAKRVIDAKGLALAPGFIDLHSHAERDILEMPELQNKIFQGITTIVGGNCGGSPLNIAEFAAQAKTKGMGPNLALLVGHNSVRRAVMENDNRLPTPDELEQMKAHVARAMQEGAAGFSTGLEYVPGVYSTTGEIVELAKVTAAYGGFYASHMRDEGRWLMKSVHETISIGEVAGLPVQISHHKVSSSQAWGKSIESLAAVDQARERGVDVMIDQYPYTASSTGLTILFPSWSLEGGSEKLAERLKNVETRVKIKEAIIDNINQDRGGEPHRIVVARFNANPELNGKNLAEITAMRGRDVTVPNAAETLLELQAEGGGSGIFHSMHEEDVKRIMQHPYAAIATDGHGVKIGEAMPHPRNYGTYPRVLGRYVREQHVLTLEESIRKMTSLPASRLRLTDRGLLHVGMKADVVIFDPATVRDKAEFGNPHHHPVGMPYVLVNGRLVIDEGRRTDALPGEFIAGRGAR